MKTRAGIRYFLTAASLTAILATYAPSGFAEDKSTSAAQMGLDGYDFIINDGLLMKDSRHPESPATLKAVVEKLRQRYEQANIVFAPELESIKIPDLKLRAHDLPEMLEAIRVASGGRFDWMGPRSPGLNEPPPATPAIDPNTGLPVAEQKSEANNGLFVLRVPRATADNERVIEALSLEPYFAAFVKSVGANPKSESENMQLAEEMFHQVDDMVVETVKNFKQIGEKEARDSLKFQHHLGGKLLVVIGPKDEVEVARKFVNALTTSGTSFKARLDDIIKNSALDASGGSSGGNSTIEREPLSTEVFALKYGDPGTADQTAVALLADPRSRVVVDQRTKALVVVATKAELSAIKKAVEQLDQAAHPVRADLPP